MSTTLVEQPVERPVVVPTRVRGSRRLAPAVIAMVILPALLLLDIGIALARGWALESQVDTLALAGAIGWLLLLSVALVLPGARSRVGAHWQPIVASVVAFGTAWLFAEVALGLITPELARPPLHRRWPGMEMTFHPDPNVMPGVSGPARYTTSALGLRAVEFPADRSVPRVLCLGGSTTECGYLDEPETWPQLFALAWNGPSGASESSIWVGNAGISGFSSRHHLRFVEESELMHQIDCLILLVGINDFSKYLETERLVEEVLRDERAAQARRPLWSYTQLRNLSRRAANVLTPTMTRHYEDPDGANYELRRNERRQATKLATLPNLERPLVEYGQRIEAIVAACRAHHVRLIVMSQPVLWRDGLADEHDRLLWLGWAPDGTYYTAESLRRGIDRYNEMLASACRKLAVEFVDLSPLSGNPAYFYDDCHFTELGAAEVARRLTDHFARHPLDDQAHK